MLIGILSAIVVIVIIFVVFVALQPADFRIVRSTLISAPPDAVFTQVNDLHNWDAWSPWAKIDPNCKKTFEGSPEGIGAIYWWSGNNKVGEGRMTVTESRPYELIRIKLEFMRPFKATNTAEFEFRPQGDQTQITWSMFGEKIFMSKAFSLFCDMDKMIGTDFEKGMALMKSLTEATATK